MEEQISKFRKFVNGVYNEQDRIRVNPSVFVVKVRSGKIDVEGYKDPSYAEYSGAANSGVVFTQKTYKHEISNAAIKKWNTFFADPVKAAGLLSELASQDGVEAVIYNERILSVKNHAVYEEIGRIK